MAHRGTLLDELFRRATEEDGKTAPAEVRFSQEVVDVVSGVGRLKERCALTLTPPGRRRGHAAHPRW